MTDAKEKKKRPKPTPIISTVLQTGELVETILDQESGSTSFLIRDGHEERTVHEITVPSGEALVPYRATNNLLAHEVVLLPSEADEYSSEVLLLAEVRAFIHRYVDVSSIFEEIATYYVLLTWIYDRFNEVPYLRVLGDFGSGKSRFLLTVGSLCYKPMIASGASSVSPLFRIMDAFRGTLVLDEGDFRVSDEKADIVKILNNGHAKGFPVLRSEQAPSGEFNPRAFFVFGPKILGTRRRFDDRALESRCITEEIGTRPLRADIPTSLPDSFKSEALLLRNKLLLFRFRQFYQTDNTEISLPPELLPRVAQVFRPLFAVVSDADARGRIEDHARAMSEQTRKEQAGADTLLLLRVLHDLRHEKKALIVGLIAKRLEDRGGDSPSPRAVGSALRRLGIGTKKSNGIYIVPRSEYKKLDQLFAYHGLKAKSGHRDVGDVQEDASETTATKNSSPSRATDSEEHPQ